MDKKVSIIIPFRNTEKYIPECLDSILRQTYSNIEVILINDCSTDNSLSICEQYSKKDNRIIIIDKREKTSISYTRNLGFQKLTGDYIMFVDSDDMVSENFVEKMVATIEEKNVDVVRCKAFFYRPDGSNYVEEIYGREGKTFRGEELNKFVAELSAYNDKHIGSYSWNLIVKRDKLKIEYNEQLSFKEDLFFLIQLLLESADSIYFLDEPLYHYRYNEKSCTKNSECFYAYVNNSTVCSRLIKDILSRHNLLTEELDKNIDYTLIKDDIHRFYLLKSYSIFEIRKRIKETFDSKELNDMIKNIDLKPLTFKAKLLILFLKLHTYIPISMYIKVAKIIT